MNLRDRYKKIREDVYSAAERCGRNPDEISILAVSKTVPHSVIQEAIDSGITLFGENRIQEAKAKIPLLNGSFSVHMIGHLQSNKSADAVKLFDLVHSIDKISTAVALNLEAEKSGKIQKVLIQIKTYEEDTKSGIRPEESLKLAENIVLHKNLELQGVMTIGPLTDDTVITRRTFRETAAVLANLNRELGLEMRHISMGMSGDYTIAVEEGSTILRIGSSIFGARH